MKYDELNALMIEFDRLRLDADRVIRKLRALGVTDLPGDAPNSPKSSDGSPGNLPVEPTEEMVEAAVCMLRMTRDATGEDYTEMRMALNAALAAAPRVEVPEITQGDADAFMEFVGSTREGLCMVRARLIARMGAKS